MARALIWMRLFLPPVLRHQ